MMKKLTARQHEILDYVVGRILENYPPTIREVAARFHVTKKVAWDYNRVFIRKGYLSESPHRSARNLRLSPEIGVKIEKGRFTYYEQSH